MIDGQSRNACDDRIAVTAQVAGISISIIGVILMVVGVIGLIVSLWMILAGRAAPQS